jgi:thiol:disulfide interchange protein DsbD
MLPPASEKQENKLITAIPTSNLCETPKYSEFLNFSNGLQGYFEYQQAIACAKKLNKPVLIDFKGHACTNCKKMDAVVWSQDLVQAKLNEFVLLGLYTDDRTQLPESEWIKSSMDGKIKKTMGQINADFQMTQFKSNALPYYVIIDPNGNLLTEPIGTELDPEKYISFLNKGLEAFNKQ